MTCNNIKYFIITGDPGVGKTSLTKKLSSMAIERGVKTSGFYTEEIRRNRLREGFDVVTLSGQRGRLARDLSILDIPVQHKVGKYGVLVEEFENIAMPCLNKPEETKSHLVVIDEIGKMEFFSEPFKIRIREIFSPVSNCTVLATIPVRKGDPLIESIRNNNQSKVWVLTRDNRNSIHEDIFKKMEATLNITY